jgi:RNA polymerase primary sigma factor
LAARPAPSNSEDVSANEEDGEQKNPREAAITAVVQKFNDHPRVERAILNQRKSLSVSHRNNLDILGSYLAEAGSYALLNAQDEVELFTLIEHGLATYATISSLEDLTPEQANDLINLAAAHQAVFHANLRLVINIAKPYWLRGLMPAVDVIQEGNVGLLKAIKRFETAQGNKFSTYATWWVRSGVTRAVADQSRLIRLPVHRHDEYNQMVSKVLKRTGELNRDLNDEEIENVTGMKIKKYREFMAQGVIHQPSLNAIIGDKDGDLVLQDLVADKNNDVDNFINEFADHEYVQQILTDSGLKAREKFVLGLRFGLGPEFLGSLNAEFQGKMFNYHEVAGTDKMTLEEAGNILGVTRERIRQIEADALRVLRVRNKPQAREQL